MIKHILVTDFGEVDFTPTLPVRFRKDGWPDRRFANATEVKREMETIAANMAAKFMGLEA